MSQFSNYQALKYKREGTLEMSTVLVKYKNLIILNLKCLWQIFGFGYSALLFNHKLITDLDVWRTLKFTNHRNANTGKRKQCQVHNNKKERKV